MTANDSRPSATTRVSIRWANGEPEERTSTLVLTTPSNLFVDFRIFNDPSAESGRIIDWAFAGLAHKREGGGSWDHWIDSRSDAPASDSGVFTMLPNGDTLEKGEMPNDHGVMQPYEEIWRDVPDVSNLAAAYVCYRNVPQAGVVVPHAAAPHISHAALDMTMLEPEHICGMIIRVGNLCQGLLKEASHITAERWTLKESGWELIFKYGNASLPCAMVCSAQLSPDCGGSYEMIIVEGRVWKCVELYGVNAAT